MSLGIIQEGNLDNFSRFNWSAKDIEKFKHRLDDIISFESKEINQHNFQELFDFCFELVDSIPLPLIYLDTNFVVRARPNYNGEVFKEQWEISYNSKRSDLIKLNRFNRPTESMFYAAVPASDQGRLIGTLSLECCKEIIDDRKPLREQYFTFGKWYLRTPFPVLNLCFHEKVCEINIPLKNQIDSYLEEIEQKLPKESAYFIADFWRFFSNLSCEKHKVDQQYFIATALMCAVKEYYSENFLGILYPSSMTEKLGVNLVLTPQAVDQYLELKQVFMFKLTRVPNEVKSYRGGVASKVAEVENGKFKISGIL